MTAHKPLVQVPDQDHYSPWGQHFAELYSKVSANNPFHAPAVLPPPNASLAESSVACPVQFPDDTESSGTAMTFVDQFKKGAELYQAGRWSLAVECFHAADRMKPGDPDNVVMMANCYQSMNQDSKAEAIYKYATDLDPHHAVAWYNRGLVLQRLNRFPEAKECHLNAFRDRYLRGMPAQESVVSSLATVLNKLGDYKSAVRVLKEGLGSCANRTPVINQLVDVMADNGDPGGAIDLLRKQEPEDLEAWYPTARSMSSLNDRFRQTDLLGRVVSPQSFSLMKHPQLQKNFRTAIEGALAKIKASGAETFSVLELSGLGLYSMWALRCGATRAACRVKAWDSLNAALRKAFTANGFTEAQAQIQEYVPSSAGSEDPLAELPSGCRLVILGVTCLPTVPLLLSRMAQFQAAGLLTVPRRATFNVVGIKCDQLYSQTNIGSIISGFDVSDFGDFCTAIRKYNLQIHLTHTKHTVLTEVVKLPINGEVVHMMRMKVELPIVEGGRLDALASWYNFELFDGVEQSMGPTCGDLWKQNIQMVHLGQDVKPGDRIGMELVITKWAKDFAQQWLMFDKIGVINAEEAKVHDTALGSFDALGGAVWHFDMMSDSKRNDAYERALKAAVKPDSVVLDIGTGSGLLAMMAARAGAKHVYACEMNADVAQKAQAVIKKNGLEDKITVFPMRSNALHIGEHIPCKVDVVVTETMGTDLLSESMYLSLHDARMRLAVPDVVLIPGRGRVLGQLVQITNPWQIDGFPTPSEGELDLRALNPLLPRFWTMTQMKKVQYTTLSNVETLLSVDFGAPLVPKGVLRRVDVPVVSAGSVNALMLWWDAHLGHDVEGDIVIETGPESRYASIDHAHWSQMVQVLTHDGVSVAAGDSVPLVVYTDNLLTHCELPKSYLRSKGQP
jgi:tetratricopeptide (TPR) repeat protein/SAM-dependent methyltransferase